MSLSNAIILSANIRMHGELDHRPSWSFLRLSLSLAIRRARQPMLGAGNICLSLIVGIACLPAIHARSGTWQTAATPYQYNAVNYSAMNLTKVEELELRI